MIKVASYDQSESSMEKTPKTYNEFIYDNETNSGILALFEDVSTQIGKVKSDIDNLHQKYDKLMNMYEEFTQFDTNMNNIIKTMSGNVSNIDKSFKSILNTCQQAISEAMENDKTLIDDLDGINKLLGGKSLSETGMSGHNGMPSDVAEKMYGKSSYSKEELSKGKITGNDPESVTNSKSDIDMASVADDIIKGKYGNGDQRRAAIEDMGLNYRDVQDIVNQKLNGTYTGNTPSGTVTTDNKIVVNNNDTPTVTPASNDTPVQTGNTNPVTDKKSVVSNQSYTNTGNEYIDLINQIRMENGLKPLSINNNLESAAGIRAEEASRYMSHTRPDGSKWYTVSNNTTGENLAFGYDNANDCVNAWMNSPDHKDVLLADDISSAGLVEYEKDGVKYVALEVS